MANRPKGYGLTAEVRGKVRSIYGWCLVAAYSIVLFHFSLTYTQRPSFSVPMSVCLFICVSVYVSVFSFSLSLSVSVSLSLSVCSSASLTVSVSLCLCLSVCLSLSLFLSCLCRSLGLYLDPCLSLCMSLSLFPLTSLCMSVCLPLPPYLHLPLYISPPALHQLSTGLLYRV